MTFLKRRSVPLLAALFAFTCAAQSVAPAQAVPGFQEAVSLNTDSTVVKRLSTIKDYLAEERWSEAVALLREISEAHADVLVPVSAGRYVNVSAYCQLVLAGLPAEGLAAYRSVADPQARQWFEQGRDAGDEQLLQKVVDQAFASSYGDDALWLLGELAWERDALALARHRWEQMLPPRESPAPGDPLPRLRYPDSNHDPADIHARLVLCSLLAGEFDRAARERQSFAEQFPDASGTLSGRSGRLAEILDAVAADVRSQDFERHDSRVQTFALNSQRNKNLPHGVDVGAPRWSVRLPESPFPTTDPRPALQEPGPLSYHPVALGDMLLVNDADRIYAFDLQTGRPWYGAPSPQGEPKPERSGDSTVPDDAVLYRPALESPHPAQPSVGVPRHTLTLHEGRVYAKLGSPVTGPAERELRDLQSDLICFDPLLSQGKLIWRVPAAELGEGWMFEGSPVVADGRVYVVLRRRQPQTLINVASFDADTGRLLWNREVCAAVGGIEDGRNWIGHQLLTLADGMLFLSTDLGAVAALDTRDGQVRWVATYESEPAEDEETLSDHLQQGLTPCLYHSGLVIAAPNDSEFVMAFDAHSGQPRWRTWLPDGIRHLLGVGQDRLILSGNRLWGLDASTGRIVWSSADHGRDPVAYGYGRGLLVADQVYWPKRGEIEVLDQQTGRMVDRIDLAAKGSAGGNLLIADEHLVVAEADRLVVFGEESGFVDPLPNLVDSRLAAP